MNSITISLRLPPKEMSPNYKAWTRGSSFAKNRAKKADTELAQLVTLEALGRRKAPMWKKATLDAVFYWPTMGFPDDDNAIGSLKGFRDGIAKAGVVTNDRILKHRDTTFLKDKDDPHVEITITEVQ